MPQKLPEIPSNNISIQSGVELYKEIRASFLEAKRFLLLFCSRYNAFSVYKVLLTKSFGEKLSTFYLLQRISMAIQRGNAICVTTCVKDKSSGLEGLFNFQVHEAEEL